MKRVLVVQQYNETLLLDTLFLWYSVCKEALVKEDCLLGAFYVPVGSFIFFKFDDEIANWELEEDVL